MKKKLLIALCAVLVLVLGMAYLELRYPVTIRRHVEMTAEEILAEMPEVAVSENDMALRDALYADPAVYEAFADLTDPGSCVNMDANRVRKLQETYYPQAEDMQIVICEGEWVYVAYYCGEQFITMGFTADGVMNKTVCVDDGKDDFIRYGYDADGNLTKEVPKHVWFAYIKYWGAVCFEKEPSPFA